VSEATVAGARVKIGGTPLEQEGQLIEVRVEENLVLPDAFLLRLSDAGLGLVDNPRFDIGKTVEVDLGGADSGDLGSVFKGEITSLEPVFEQNRAEVAVRGYDESHKLHRTRRTMTYQNMTSSDIARKVAEKAGFSLGQVDESGPNPPHAFVQQNNETDWQLLQKLARMHDFEVLVQDRKLHFRRPGPRSNVKLKWGEELISFRPRVSGVQQVKEVVVRGWDPQRKAEIEAKATVGRPDSRIGVDRQAVADALSGGTLTIADSAARTIGEADERARSIAARIANGYLQAEGVCRGNELVRAGAEIEIEGLGSRFNGTYTCSSTTHVYRGAKGYTTHFVASGRAPRTMVELLNPSREKSWGSCVVVGKVTQNDDPEGMGRVRVTYPELGGDNEGWWARIASPSAGKDRGLLMMPVVGEEVLISFEHGDVRAPYVLGSLWNGEDTPGDLVQKDGSFVLQSDKKVTVAAKDAIAISGDSELTIEAERDVGIESKRAAVTVKGATSVTVEGRQSVTIKVGSASISLNAAGVVQISGSQVMLG
jgi:phage protein D